MRPDGKFVRQTALTIGALALLAGCGLAPSSQPEEAAVAKPPVNPFEIEASENLLERLEIGEPEWTSVSAKLSVASRVEVDEHRAVRVGAQVSGRVKEVFVNEGDTVERGKVLAIIYSTQLSETQAEFLKAVTRQQLAQRAVERAQQLLDADVIGIAELQRREAELADAQAEIAAARDQLAVLGLSEKKIDNIEKTRSVGSLIELVAPESGTILRRHVTVGQVVQESDTAFEIADLGRVWLVADVPEQSIGSLRAGSTVEAEVPAIPDRAIRGKLSYVSPTVNPNTRTVEIRMDVLNRDRRLKPAMLANMTLTDYASVARVVPASAVVRENNREYVFVQMTDNLFALREVELGDEFENARVLIDGVREGQQIVLDGAFHLNNERRRRAVSGEEG
ncbi:MAG: efflux RND transporter periplasmic adaptor subunit [Acidobacteria bacterium]|nr:efflux RND transporter periplasmic adaptor subunit [Acidobacteriota bacterium]